jgi:hypothetical protein
MHDKSPLYRFISNIEGFIVCSGNLGLLQCLGFSGGFLDCF